MLPACPSTTWRQHSAGESSERSSWRRAHAPDVPAQFLRRAAPPRATAMNPDRWQQIEELYHAAREDRTVLDRADPELRREVESLLAQEKGAGYLESPALDVAAQQFAGRDLIGRRIGSYQV